MVLTRDRSRSTMLTQACEATASRSEAVSPLTIRPCKQTTATLPKVLVCTFSMTRNSLVLSVRWLLLFSSSRLVQCKNFLYDRVPTFSDVGNFLCFCAKNQPVDPGGSVVRLGSSEEEPNDPRPLTGFLRSTLTFSNSKCGEGRFRFNLFREFFPATIR